MNTDNPSELKRFWSEHIDAWRVTDLTQRAYCQQHGLPVHRFSYWKRKLTDTNEPISDVQGFVQLSPMAMSHSTLNLQLPNQLRIEGITSDNLYLVKQLTELLQ